MCPGIGEFVSGAILYDETLRQSTSDGVAFPTAMWDAGIICGIKVDTGAKQLAGCPSETVTEGLDGLRDRIAEYAELGARFAKWRAVIQVDTLLPTRTALVGINPGQLGAYDEVAVVGELLQAHWTILRQA